jgi:hypothetical protein
LSIHNKCQLNEAGGNGVLAFWAVAELMPHLTP